MATYEKFEELGVWKQSMELCACIYELTNKGLFSKDYALKDQVRKSAISVPSNISEGFERDSKKQFIYFLVISKGSCGELRTQLKIARVLDYVSEADFNTMNEKCLCVSKQLSGFISYLKNKN
jgi:four helix bundle protein